MTYTKIGETIPLVADEASKDGSTTKRDFYDAAVEEAEARSSLKKKRNVRLAIGTAAVLLVVAAFLRSGASNSAKNASAALFASIKADHLFAGLLADDKAFYFPTKVNTAANDTPSRRRRNLRALGAKNDDPAPPPAIDWSFKMGPKDGSAIGEYYKAKGLALANYYKSMYKQQGGGVSAAAGALIGSTAFDNADAAAAASDPSVWTDDWKQDKARGIALGQKYEAIGKAIDDHYLKAFSHANKDDSQTNDEEYDWQQDAKLGKEIGKHYKAIGKHIADHYKQDFADITNNNTTDWSEKWKEYKKKGQEIADYYKSKGEAIDQFYKGKYALEGMNRPELEAAVRGTADDDASAETTAPNTELNQDANQPYVWGLDWRKDRDHSIAIRHGLMKKGMSISDYYRAKYDPTYNTPSTTQEDENKKSNKKHNKRDGSATTNEVSVVGPDDLPRNPDLVYPPWGTDPEADRQHGIALHEYWKKVHELEREHYQKTSDDLGKYYEDFYRTKFDPTYKNYGGN